MNVHNIQQVIDHLKALPPERFDMCKWAMRDNDVCTSDELVHDCGTTGCIAGWAVALLEPRAGLLEYAIKHRAQELFGLDEVQAFELFVSEGHIRVLATRDDAVQVLEHMLATGEIDWGRVVQ